MKGYNFEKSNNDFDKTVKLDKIHEEVRKHEENRKKKTEHKKSPQEDKAAGGRVNNPKHGRGKKPFRYFTIIIIIICIAAFAIVFSLAYKKSSQKASEIKDNYEETIKADELQKEEYQNIATEFSALITSMPNSSDKAVGLYDINGNISRTLYPANNVSLSGFSEGDIVDVSANLYLSKLQSISESSTAFKAEDLTGFSYNANKSIISSSTQSYNVSTKTIFKLNNENGYISSLNKHDTISISGIGDTVFFINVDKPHGTIVLENASTLAEGQLIIDGNTTLSVSENLSAPVSPGTHKISLSGSNINPYSTEVFVSSGDSYKLDISKIPKKTGAISIKSNVSDFYISIDGGEKTLRRDSETLIISPGTHKITITKEGYNSFETSVDIVDAYSEIEVTLEKEIKSGTLTIVSTPDEADVYINGSYKGITPYIEALNYDTYSVLVEKRGYKSYSGLTEIKEDHQSVECVLAPIEED